MYTYLHSSLGAASLGLLLLLGVNFWSLTLDLTGTGEGTVDFTTKKTWLSGQGHVLGDAALLKGETGWEWHVQALTSWNLKEPILAKLEIRHSRQWPRV